MIPIMIFGNVLNLLPHPQLILAAAGIFLIIFDPVWHYLTRPRTNKWIETTGVVVDYIEKHGGLNNDNRVDWEQVPVVEYETADGTRYRESYVRHWREREFAVGDTCFIKYCPRHPERFCFQGREDEIWDRFGGGALIGIIVILFMAFWYTAMQHPYHIHGRY